MKLAISNIAWTPNEEPAVAKALQRLGVRYVEIAPTKVWDDPLTVSDEQITEYLDFWKAHDIEVVAFQSMLFPRPDLKLFSDEANRAETLTYLKAFIKLAGKMQARVMVFGSPKNRQRGDMPDEEANAIAIPLFAELGNEAQQHNVRFCIEPNAPQYACDFVTTAEQGINLVNAVSNPGFGLHLDIACMTLAGDDPTAAITAAGSSIQHFHISSPMLESVAERPDVDHAAAGKALQAVGYDKFVSIEMRPEAEGTNLVRVEQAVVLANKYYNM
jgi:D-psicose/D-tagatose/L-ribulose 3-epimerase